MAEDAIRDMNVYITTPLGVTVTWPLSMPLFLGDGVPGLVRPVVPPEREAKE